MKKNNATTKSVGMLFGGNLLGKLLGVAREVLLAASYGTSLIGGAYRVANTATFIPINFFTSDSLNAAFIPLYVRYKQAGRDQSQTLFWSVAVLLEGLALLISLALIYMASLWVKLLAPGFVASAVSVTVDFVRVMAWGVPFYVAGALFAALEAANEGFRLASSRSSLQNLWIMGGIGCATVFSRPVLIAYSFVVAYVIFALDGLLLVCREKMLAWPAAVDWGIVKEVMAVFWQTLKPLLLLPVFKQGNIAIERAVASLIGLDTVSALDYAKFMTETAVLLFAVPLGLVGLSTLSVLSDEQLKVRVKGIVLCLLVVTVPISVFLAVYSEPIVRILYARGSFGESSVAATSWVMAGLAVGLWAQVCGYVLMKVLSARLRNREVLFVMLVALILNVLVNVSFYRFWGSLTLGLGVSLYGLAVFGLGVRALSIGAAIREQMLWLALGGVVSGVVGVLLPVHGMMSFILAALLFWMAWIVYVAAIPQLRDAIYPALAKIRGI